MLSVFINYNQKKHVNYLKAGSFKPIKNGRRQNYTNQH